MNAEAERAIDAALDARDAGRAEDGVPVLQAALTRHPGYARLWQVLGLLHRTAGDGGAAAAAFGQAAQLAPQVAKIAHSVAQASLEAGHPALAAFDRARALAPADGEVLTGRAAAQLAEGQGKQAIADLDAVLLDNPLWLAGHQALARLRAQAGESRPEASIERALAQAPGEAMLWGELLNSLLHAGRFADADAAIARGRSAGIGGLDAFEAIAASELGEADRADRLFAALGPDPGTAMAVRHIRHLLRTGQAAEAAARIGPLLDRPDADEAWPYAALAWRLTGDARWAWLEGDARLVGVHDLGAAAGDLGALAERLRALHLARAEPLGQSVRSGTQTDGPLFMRADPEIRTLRAAIVDAVEAHRAQLPPPDPRHPLLRHRPERVRFAGSWSVRLTGAGGGRHSNHIHPQGWLSSAFYVSVPGEAERGAAPAGWLTLGEAPAELNLDLPALRQVEPRPGRLVLFPSLMWHGTRPFASGERLTVAFDVAR